MPQLLSPRQMPHLASGSTARPTATLVVAVLAAVWCCLPGLALALEGGVYSSAVVDLASSHGHPVGHEASRHDLALGAGLRHGSITGAHAGGKGIGKNLPWDGVGARPAARNLAGGHAGGLQRIGGWKGRVPGREHPASPGTTSPDA
jgi:hypothetical protein